MKKPKKYIRNHKYVRQYFIANLIDQLGGVK